MADAVKHETVLEATGMRARIARVYAQALIQAATSTGQVDELGDELNGVAKDVVKGHPKIAGFFGSTAIGKAAKVPVLAAAFEHTTSETFRKFIGVLNQNGRLDLLPAINAEYSKLRDSRDGRVRVRVTTALTLTDEQIAALKQTLSEQLKAQPILDIWVNPDLLGGLVVQVGDKVYDTSVRSRLENLRTHLMASGTHV